MSQEKGGIDPDLTSLTEVVTESIEKQPPDPDGEKKTEKKRSKNPTETEDHFKHKSHGKHAIPTRTIWVQFLDDEGGLFNETSGEVDNKTRNRFVVRVFAIVLGLLLFTTLYNVIVNTSPSLRRFMRRNKLALVLFVACAIGQMLISLLVLCSKLGYYPPGNYIILFLTLIFMSYISGYITAMVAGHLVIIALIATIIVVIFIMLIAMSSVDLTKYWTVIMIGATAFFVVSAVFYIVQLATGMKLRIFDLVFTAIGTVVQSVVLILILQSIIGGKTVEMTEELYIFAAYLVYTSVINLFLKILRLVILLEEYF